MRLLLSTYNQYVLDTKKDYAKVRSIILNSPEIYDICKSLIFCLFFDSLDAEILHWTQYAWANLRTEHLNHGEYRHTHLADAVPDDLLPDSAAAGLRGRVDPPDQRAEHVDQQDQTDAHDRPHGDTHAHEGHRQGPWGVRGRARPTWEFWDELDHE